MTDFKVTIIETKEVKTWHFPDEDPVFDYINEMIDIGCFVSNNWLIWDKELETWYMNQERYDWWDKIVKDSYSLQNRIKNMQIDPERIYSVMVEHKLIELGLTNYAKFMNDILDEYFDHE